MPSVEAYEIAKDICLIDTRLHAIPRFNAVYLIKGEKLALMEAGDHTTADAVLAGIRQLGFQPRDVAYIFCSHIHLDHSGAAGLLVPHMPQAQVVVQERGARHVADPSRLIESYGSFGGDPAARSLIKPVPSQQITAVKGGETFSLGQGKTIQVVATPGHSPHSVSYLYSPLKGLFPGDCVGVYLGEENILMPVAAPPGYDHDQALASLRTLSGMSIDALFFPHYAMAKNVAAVMSLAQRQWTEWGELALRLFKASDAQQMEAKMREQARRELKAIEKRQSLYDYMTGELVSLSTQGFSGYYQKKASQG